MDLTADGRPAALARLTRRELEVLHRTALGETNTQIAARLGVTVHAVKYHLASIFRKLRVRNRTTAAAFYVTHARELE